MNKLNFAFFGTPDVASKTLDILKNNGYLPSIIITSPDKPAGRGLLLTPSPVSIWAKNNNIPILKPEKIKQEFIDEFIKYNVDLSIVVAYGKILPEVLINIPKLETINIHYSLLPKHRGASPLESSLLNGDEVTGVSIQQMVFKLDSGPILADNEVSIGINETKEDLKNILIETGGNLLCEIIPKIIEKSIQPKIQDESQATFCTKIKKEDGELNFNNNALNNYNKYRAFYGWPSTYFFVTKNGVSIRVKIKEATYENNLFIIKRVTPEGKKEISYEDFLKQN
ncbi:MAG TPA: methionyl-tRNA formyltransferase [Candidatus Paceibacterota bacterium]